MKLSVKIDKRDRTISPKRPRLPDANFAEPSHLLTSRIYKILQNCTPHEGYYVTVTNDLCRLTIISNGSLLKKKKKQNLPRYTLCDTFEKKY